MKRPFKYTIICNKTGKHWYQNSPPIISDLQTYEPTADPKIWELKQTKTAYIDTRYEAKLRLYKYVRGY
jgi:hypothetical protein